MALLSFSTRYLLRPNPAPTTPSIAFAFPLPCVPTQMPRISTPPPACVVHPHAHHLQDSIVTAPATIALTPALEIQLGSIHVQPSMGLASILAIAFVDLLRVRLVLDSIAMLPSIFVHQVHLAQLLMVWLPMLVHANVERKYVIIPMD